MEPPLDPLDQLAWYEQHMGLGPDEETEASFQFRIGMALNRARWVLGGRLPGEGK
jgi:hypothetical protein